MFHQFASNEQIESWKNQYGAIYKTVIDGEVFIYRGLTINEYTHLINEKENAEAQSWVLYRATLFSSINIDELEDPQLIQLYNLVYSAATCFGNIDELYSKIEKLRNEYCDNLWKGVCIYIIRVMPIYKLEELENLTIDKLLDLYMAAEMIHGQGNEFLRPLRQKKPQKRPKTKPQPQQIPQKEAENEPLDILSQRSVTASQSDLARVMEEHKLLAQKGEHAKHINPLKENDAFDSYIKSLNRK